MSIYDYVMSKNLSKLFKNYFCYYYKLIPWKQITMINLKWNLLIKKRKKNREKKQKKTKTYNLNLRNELLLAASA